MKQMKIAIQKLPAEKADCLAKAIPTDGIREFFADPAVQARYEAWLKAQEEE